MINRLTIIFLYLFYLSAMFVCYKAKAQVALGGKLDQNQSAITLGDFHTFDLSGPDSWGYERYGVGRGQFDLAADRLGGLGDNRSGVLLGSGSGFRGAIEPVSGRIGYHDRPEYQWEPAVSMGFKGLGFYAGPRVGMSRSNVGNDDFVGVVIQIFRFTYWENDYKQLSPLRIYNFNLWNKFSIEKRLENRDNITMISVRFEL